jgi:hypothetical protein
MTAIFPVGRVLHAEVGTLKSPGIDVASRLEMLAFEYGL